MNTSNNNIKSSLSGTKTEINLKDAAANEALSHIRYTIFSDIAKESGQLDAAKKFTEFANHEKEHAELWLSYLDELSETEENLDRAISGETYEAEIYYPDYSRIAKEEGFHEISDKFAMTANAERRHSEHYKKILKTISENEYLARNAESHWHCTNCGYYTKGNMPPERCPLCNYPKHYFAEE